MFLFDVDGTLTPSRQKIDKEFSKFFSKFCKDNDVFLVTGSDRNKTIEQIGKTLYNKAKRVYNCSGNSVWEKTKNVHKSEWSLPDDARTYLNLELNASKFELRTGTHIEDRPGCVNFSIVGRGATVEQRLMYKYYDEKSEERVTLASNIRRLFPDLSVTVGGETGIDIAPKGHDKSQILQDFETYDTITFFGDKTRRGGNDYSIAHAIITKNLGDVHDVSDYNETWNILKSQYT
jgi:phosphomannomutase